MSAIKLTMFVLSVLSTASTIAGDATLTYAHRHGALPADYGDVMVALFRDRSQDVEMVQAQRVPVQTGPWRHVRASWRPCPSRHKVRRPAEVGFLV